MIYAKEQAKLQRAKERSKLKKLQRQQQQQQLQETEEVDRQVDSHHERSNSQPLSLGVAPSRAESRQSRRSENGLQSASGRPFDENGRHSRTSANIRSFDENVRPPARRPYLNPGAIDLHRSEFAVHRDEENDDDEEAEDEGTSDEEEVDQNIVEKEIEEPQ